LKKENNEGKSKKSKGNQNSNPQRRQHPDPRPSNVTSQFQTDKQYSQKTRKTDTTGGRGRVARHGCLSLYEYNITPLNVVVKGFGISIAYLYFDFLSITSTCDK
jgi:hypothetical protein